MDLARAVQQAVTEALAACRKVGTVSTFTANRVVVTVNGGTMTLPRMTHYSPTIGDVVQIDATVPDAWVVLGKVA